MMGTAAARGAPARIRRPAPSVIDPYDALAPYYDLIAPSDGADLDLYATMAGALGGPVLELGAGTGRVAVPLAVLGNSVTGIEPSRAMLARAQQRAAAAGVAVDLRCTNMLAYELAPRFSFILCAQDTFLHLTEQRLQIDALALAGRHLAPGGRLVLDLPALGGEWSAWEPGVRPLDLAWSGPDEGGSGLVQHFTTFTADPSTQIRNVTHILDVTDASGHLRRLTVQFALRFIAPGELPLLVRAAGLRLDAVYGDYDRSPFGPDSRRMVAVIKE